MSPDEMSFLIFIPQATIEAGGRLSKTQALSLASVNTEKLLGVRPEVSMIGDLVVTNGGDLLDFQSKIIAVISPSRGQVDLF